MLSSKFRSASLFLGACVLAASTLFAGIVLSRSDASEPAHAYYSPSTTYTNGDGATYYSGISGTATGTTLLSALQSLNSSKRQKTIGYTAMGTSASSSPYVYTDYDPNGTTYTDSNNQIYGASILSFYSKTSVTSFNKEHTWPNSHGGSAVEADIHMPRPTIPAENSNRGNSFYVEGVVSSTSGWDPYTAGYSEISRGEAARTIFYCMVASSSLNLSEATIISSGETGYANTMGKLSDMLSWNLRYSVTTYEQNRNEGAEYLQGNRNPFIDHPEYACKIWGNTNSTTQAICSASQSAPNTITLSPSTSSIAVGGTVTLGVTVDTGSNSVTWSSSNSSVASVSNGVVTGVAAGSATITATSTVDTSIKGTAAITVKSLSSLSVSGTPNTTSYTAGQSFDSTGLTVTATYSDSSTTNVTSSVVWTPSTLTAGTTSVTGSYGEKTVTVSGLTVTASSSSNALYTFSSKSWATATGTDNWVSGKDGIGYANSGVQISTGASGANARSPISFSNMTEIVVGYCTNASKGAGQIIMYSQPTIDGTATEIGRFSVTTSGGTTRRETTAFVPTEATKNGYVKIEVLCTTNSIYLIDVNIKSLSAVAVGVTGVSLNTFSLSLYTGDTSTLTATVSPSDATNKNVSWASTNNSVASVSGGLVTAVGAGSATITVTTEDGSFTSSCSVTVTALVLSSISSSGTLTKSSYFTGQSFDSTGLTITATYNNSTTANVTSSVSWTPNPLTAGTTSVTGSYSTGGVTKTVVISGITVSNPVLSSISTSGQTTSYSIGGTYSYDGVCTATYTDSSTSTVTPTVDSSLVNMNAEGTYVVTLSFTSGGVTKTATYNITVSDAANISGVYTLTSSATAYTTATSAETAAACIGGLDTALTVTDQSNMRFYGSPITTDMMFGGSSTGAYITLGTTDSNFIVSKVVIKAQSYSSTTISTIVCAGMSQQVTNYYTTSTNNYADFTFYPLETTFTISTVASNYRIFANSIEVTVVRLSDGDDAYGELFNSTTASECSAMSGISSANWTLLSTVYTNANTTVKNNIANTVASSSGTAIQEAMARYDMIVSKYSSTDFLNRHSSSTVLNKSSTNNNAILIILTALSLISVAGFAFYIKKRKAEK